MKRLGRFIFILFLALSSIGIIGLGIILLTQHQDWITIGFAVAIILFGVAVAASAWATSRGAHIKDILEDIFLGLP